MNRPPQGLAMAGAPQPQPAQKSSFPIGKVLAGCG